MKYLYHPEYMAREEDWLKFRLILKGGRVFKDEYLKQKPNETDKDYARRKCITPVPSFAKAAVRKIRNAIYQRLDGVRRHGGSDKFLSVMNGQLGGVDLKGANMEYFMGHEILPELLGMGRVGIYVDAPNIPSGRTMKQNKNLHPYLYKYATEDICNWDFFLDDEELKLRRLLLRVRREKYDDVYSFVTETVEQYRMYHVDADGVWVRFFDEKGTPTDIDGNLSDGAPVPLVTDRIPFVWLELEASLLEDVADHQVALLNMESLDVSYCWRANAPYYTEQFDPAFELAWAQHSSQQDLNDEENGSDQQNPNSVTLGTQDGRRYPKELDRPKFIAPPADPMLASMEKQHSLKDDIDRILNLAVATSSSRYASAESKSFDERGLDSGLAAIGLMLEMAERQVGILWPQYDVDTKDIFVKYPERYSLRSEDDRRKEATTLSDLASKVPSNTWRRMTYKEMAETMFGGKASDEELKKLFDEIESNIHPTSDPEQIRADVEVGLVSREMGSEARGWPKGQAELANKEKAERDAVMLALQGKQREQTQEENQEEKDESQDPENNSDGQRLVRGEEK